VTGGGKNPIILSEEGIELAKSFASLEELEAYQTPTSDDDHHKKIISKLERNEKAKKYGPKIFQYMVGTKDDPPMTKQEIADHFNTLADSHGFFYGFQGK
jgi:hypothetical protein